MINKTKRAFTLIELLVVVGIIALLAGILIPAVNIARTKAKEASTRAMIHSIEMGLQMFSNDFGNFPSSAAASTRVVSYEDNITDPTNHRNSTDLGAHHLFNAMAGIDILGYASNDDYNLDTNGNPTTTRKDPYINVEKTPFVNFRTADDPVNEWKQLNIDEDSSYEVLNQNLNPVFTTEIKPRKARPLLYYRAHKNEHLIGNIYNSADNYMITEDQNGSDYRYPDFIGDDNNNYANVPSGATQTFEQAIWNTESSRNVDAPQARPYNAKTFLLISAGADGLYGTEDDITNWAQ